jgi:CRISPR/Cas system-associated exonuclease Cas4 (RecB family)
MELTEKQEAFVKYLLKRLGFSKGEALEKYLEKLEVVAHIYRIYRAIMQDEIENDDPPPYYWFDGEKFLPEKYDIVDFLLDEYKLKKEKKYEINRNISTNISATDLANYTFCPIGYSIGRSFDIKRLSLSETGAQLHAQCRLLRRLGFSKGKPAEFEEEGFEYLDYYITEENKAFFNEIENSQLIFSGHSENEHSIKYFLNSNISFIGQPDYVFRNKDGKVFIIEEKFKRERYRGFDTFFRNHKVQLASYIYFLDELNAAYGYLVYWMYDYIENHLHYERCLVQRVDKSENAEKFLNEAYNGVKDFMQKKYYNFNTEILDPKKCASCVYCMYCGHKNGRRNQVSLPYQRGYHNLYPAEFPEILRHESEDQPNDFIPSEYPEIFKQEDEDQSKDMTGYTYFDD